MSRGERTASSNGIFSPLGELVWSALGRAVPDVVRPGHVFGVLTFFFLAVQVVTGLLLMVYYQPSAATAHYSIGVLLDEVRLGWLMRAVHSWSSDLLILFAFVHMVRVYFVRAYLPPRRLGWATGVLLLAVIVGLGLTGSLLPWDQYAFWSVDGARETVAHVPLVGSTLLSFFWGGWEVGEEVLLRFYALHVGILPFIGLALLGMHLLAIWNAGLQRAPHAAERRFGIARSVSDLLLDLLVVVLLAFGVLLTLAVVYPPPLLAPADPLTPLANAQPRWYLLAARQLLRNLPRAVAALAVVALLALIWCVPLLDRSPAQSRWGRVLHWGLGLVVIAVWLLLAARQYYRF
jgi:quinol-cytochrome oxidoreductase complex cytochrome b subunit